MIKRPSRLTTKSRAVSCPAEMIDVSPGNGKKPPPNKKPDFLIVGKTPPRRVVSSPDNDDEDYVVMNMKDVEGLDECAFKSSDTPSKGGGVIAKALQMGTHGVIGIGTGVAPLVDNRNGKSGQSSPLDRGVKNGDQKQANGGQGARVEKGEGEGLSQAKASGVQDQGASKGNEKTSPSELILMKRRDGRKMAPPVLSRVPGAFFTDKTDV